ncbi:Imm61 family immunity protein [Naasia lichenicola]|uniref:Uncharacterized protein n=1 Tax=Naasia lichenicola TaxID=2565933 RepID=A0A4S4FEP0_9MICO|nr:Imm61 family immunity protein [Naasia lichenicola]THG28629.1 hypothetical protein E6C64_17685 [Naasia lichenicola]
MEDLIAWAERGGLEPVTRNADDLLHVADAHVAFAIAAHHDLFPVEAARAGQDRVALGVFESLEDAQRFLVMELGAIIRAHRSLPRLISDGLPPGYVIEEAPTALWLTWLLGSAEFPVAPRSRGRATNFSRISRAPVETIESSFLAPSGHPLFEAA